MKTMLVLLLFTVHSWAVGLDVLIDQALEKSPSLESIALRFESAQSTIDLSSQFENPVLSLSDNTLSHDQAMSQSIIGIQQKIPYFGKREAKEALARAGAEVIDEELNSARVALVKAIKKEAYRIWELEASRSIIEDYVHLTKQNISLFESYTATSDAQHMGIMSAELTLSDLRIQSAFIDAKIASSYARLSYLCAQDVKELDIDLTVWDLPSEQSLTAALGENTTLALREKKIRQQEARVNVASLDNYPDINLMANYAYRENFDNYFTFGVGITLPVYGSEDMGEEKERKLALSAKSLREDTRQQVDSAFKVAYTQMASAYRVYHIVQDEALPQVEHMFELTNSSIATGGDLFKYIDILKQKLQLEQKSIASVGIYNRAMADIEALSGETE